MFTIDNIPFGIVSIKDLPGVKYVATVIDNDTGRNVIIIQRVHEVYSLHSEAFPGTFVASSLNAFIALGKNITRQVRLTLQTLIHDGKIPLNAIIPIEKCVVHLPVEVRDYTDFYACKQHAENVGKMFRPNNPLLPNWSQIPIGYHGRASSIVVSGTGIHHPSGVVASEDSSVTFGKSEKLDYELELGFIVGKDSQLGTPVEISEAEDYIFGVVLLNDWSARDIQKYEYVPLGPFLGKNFATTISPWVVTMEALSTCRTAQLEQNPIPLKHLLSETRSSDGFDIDLTVSICSEGQGRTLTPICKTNSRNLYWSVRQMVTHHTSNGCNLRIGDIIATGTISGDTSNSLGSLLEKTRGKGPFLSIGNKVSLQGIAKNGEIVIYLGNCDGIII